MIKERGKSKERIGVVVSDKMDKTVVVKVDNMVKHAVYKKYIKRCVTYKAHDEQNSAKIGDLVKIIESRPISKEKRWALVEILEQTPA